MTGVQLSDLSTDRIGDALAGWWMKQWDKVLRLSVLKSHAFLDSIIVSEPTQINMALPNHEAFYMEVLSPSGVRTVFVDKNASISLTLDAGEALRASFTLIK